jgi:hypothetical protein
VDVAGGRTIFVARGPNEDDGVAIIELLRVTKLVTGGTSSKSKRNGNDRRKRSE